jgi:predicted HTH domain antitoxin
MLSECQKDRTEEQYQALKKLFAWLAYSKRALTLNEASELVALTANESVFEVEDELIGRSARYVLSFIYSQI